MANNSGQQSGRETLGQYMKRRRMGLGLSQQEVARRGGPSQSWQSHAEADKDSDYPRIPKPSMIIRLAKAYGVSVTEVEEAAGLQRGATLPPTPPPSDLFLEIEGRRPHMLSTGDVLYLSADETEPKITALAADAFFQAWRKGRRAEQ